MKKLPKVLKKNWIKALRSGKYQQITGQLKNEGGYCCLGVLCEVTGIGITEDGKNPIDKSGYSYFENLLGTNEYQALYFMNDDKVPFEVIAGFINENL